MTEIVVTDCGDCPFHSFYGQLEWNHCGKSGFTETQPDINPIFNQCPLKTNSIQITLKKDDDGKEIKNSA